MNAPQRLKCGDLKLDLVASSVHCRRNVATVRNVPSFHALSSREVFFCLARVSASICAPASKIDSMIRRGVHAKPQRQRAEAVWKLPFVVDFCRASGVRIVGFVEGLGRGQTVLFPDRLEDWIGEESLVRVVDLFVAELDLPGLGFRRAAPARPGRPGYHPAVPGQFVHLWLSEPYPVQSQAGARGGAQRRGDVADGQAGSGSQVDCRLSTR